MNPNDAITAPDAPSLGQSFALLPADLPLLNSAELCSGPEL